ncbi:hypothetical protein [Acinetobacter bohemicus]|uniref:hypothetical protein n=1 Tax=Acinetobacter bohemicus TaxID=1435036 RepID=UPI003FA2388A
MNNLIAQLMIKTAWDIAEAGGDVMVIHPRGCGKTQFQETAKAYSDQNKQMKAQQNYLQIAGKPKPFSVRMRRQRVKA